MRQRIVVTGIGGLCGLGNDAPSIWSAMREGRSAIGPLASELLADLKVKIGSEVKTLPDHGIERKRTVTMDRFSLFAVIAAREALAPVGASGRREEHLPGRRDGRGRRVRRGSHRRQLSQGVCRGKSRPEIFTVPKIMPGAAAGQVSMHLGLRGPTFGVTSACSSSNHALASAMDQLILGRADVMVAGGAEAPLSWGVLKSWDQLRIMAPDTCRPFSADRQGVVMGEGAAMAVLETYEHAKARGATILAELAGVGMSADASDIVAPTVERADGGDAFLPGRCRTEPGGRRLHQRARHRHQGERPDRDRGDQEGVRRACGEAFHFLDQVDARPLPWRVGRARDDRLRDGHPRRRHPADGELPRAGPRMRPRRHAQRGARAQGACCGEQRVLLSAAPTRWWPSRPRNFQLLGQIDAPRH